MSKADTKTYVTCAACQRTWNSDKRIPTLKFYSLVGEPEVCEACVAESFGIKAHWNREKSILMMRPD
jgi:hypothetical protein